MSNKISGKLTLQQTYCDFVNAFLNQQAMQ